MSGAGTAALCGCPDAGITTLTEVVANARYIVNSVSIPVMVDGEAGFGNIHALRRTVREIMSTGATSMFLEDQAELRRCGFIAGKRVLPLEEALAKYRAAVDVRNELDPDFVLTARSDARGAVGVTSLAKIPSRPADVGDASRRQTARSLRDGKVGQVGAGLPVEASRAASFSRFYGVRWD